MRIRDLSVTKKIGFSFLSVLLVFIAVNTTISQSVLTLDKQIQIVTERSIPSLELIKGMQVDITKVRKDEFSLLPNANHPDLGKWLQDLDQWREDVQTKIKQYEALDLTTEERSKFEVFKSTWQQYIDKTSTYNTLLSRGDAEQANKIVLGSFSTYSKALTSLDEVIKLNQSLIGQIKSTVVSEVQQSFYFIGFGSLLTVLVIIAISLGLGRVLRRPLNRAVEFAQQIANGNLSVAIQREELSKDELGTLLDALSKMQTNLYSLVNEINDSSLQLTTAVEEVSAISSQTAQGMQQQEQELSSVASAMTEMQAAINEVAQSTENGAESSNLALNQAKSGSLTLQNNISIISNVASSVELAGQLANELEQNSNNINVVVDVIRDIAEQTNLLALNAAIEAARAGEQGRGFAVVADEVRSLAQRTQDSTTQIVDIVKELQVKANQTGEATRQCQEGISTCVEQTSEASRQIVDIEKSIDNIAAMSTQIAAACNQQNTVSEELNRSVETINSSATEMTEGTSQTSVACQEISSLSHNLKTQIEKFRLS
ncbi:Methyl-accepting chemotaxis protein I (serine chemoreceptor protein) [Photobacterium marinum]|uniref:Methyl-accepting chemotaxis protein I (Serine chemoreceptor protein) n=1 Tax=Photobacterium marinum TaxID=1056511 RepID=L8JG34_9GAMM|nr:methyl-accepting chemotaxis protein [Photobacterium marinum]ELR66479.1 Methyl-accepting chemotaxis protein I (serine chemoreceptor protein) [Photobacterium marinum]